MYIYIYSNHTQTKYLSLYMYIYIYIDKHLEREREREADMQSYFLTIPLAPNRLPFFLGPWIRCFGTGGKLLLLFEDTLATGSKK